MTESSNNGAQELDCSLAFDYTVGTRADRQCLQLFDEHGDCVSARKSTRLRDLINLGQSSVRFTQLSDAEFHDGE